MKYRVLAFDLFSVSGWYETLKAAVLKCTETMNQSHVWFIEDENNDIVRLIHCGVVYLPEENM